MKFESINVYVQISQSGSTSQSITLNNHLEKLFFIYLFFTLPSCLDIFIHSRNEIAHKAWFQQLHNALNACCASYKLLLRTFTSYPT